MTTPSPWPSRRAAEKDRLPPMSSNASNRTSPTWRMDSSAISPRCRSPRASLRAAPSRRSMALACSSSKTATLRPLGSRDFRTLLRPPLTAAGTSTTMTRIVRMRASKTSTERVELEKCIGPYGGRWMCLICEAKYTMGPLTNPGRNHRDLLPVVSSDIPSKVPVMRLAYFDCFSGISGDMALGALVHAGADLDEIAKALSTFPIDDFDLAADEVDVRGMPALTIHVHAGPQGVIRTWSSMRSLLDESDLPAGARRIAQRMFHRLA